jgi:tRNA (cmo5U34)-methyltransferase
LSQDEIDAHKQKRHANDFPITLTKHIQLMQKVGFTDAEVIWKYYSNAIYGASK